MIHTFWIILKGMFLFKAQIISRPNEICVNVASFIVNCVTILPGGGANFAP